MDEEKLRWKQVKILHGPATVRREFCSYATVYTAAAPHGDGRMQNGHGKADSTKISESGNMHEAASFTVPEKHRVKFFIGEMQYMEESICLMKEKGTAKTGCSRRKRVPQAAAF